jgi:hypothetical protein
MTKVHDSVGKMPIDTAKWKLALHRSNFMNVSAQFTDVNDISKSGKILIVGPGQGLEKLIFEWRGYEVITIDVDEILEPDLLASVHDLGLFDDKLFDFVIVSHVLEHIPPHLLSLSLSEISRVSKYALIYLPTAGRFFQCRLIPGVRNLDFSFTFSIFNIFDKPDDEFPRYVSGQHYWEVGRPGFNRRKLRREFRNNFHILKEYRNKDWPTSYNYVLKSK